MTVYTTFDPTALYAGNGPYRHRNITLKQGAAYLRGTVLGLAALAVGAGAAVVAAVGGNTGNGVVTPDAAAPVQANAKAGIYVIKYTAATTFDVFDPDGRRLASGANGATYADQIKFSAAAGGTPFVAGDSFTVTLAKIDKYVPSIATAIDGSQNPAAILAADTDTTAADVVCPAYFEGPFAGEKLIIDASWSIATLEAAFRQSNRGIFIKALGTLG